ncbi:MAG TPA: NAD(+)/NADH kinase [Dehalococcoidia bacterium]|nr:NAD(+)/NADH kinase [Dehalococcoidia bacterium]
MQKVGIFVHPRWEAAHALARELEINLRQQVAEVWIAPAWEEDSYSQQLPGSELLICVGGDGTMLWAARTVCPAEIPILGVNMGRLGFLAEIRPREALEKLPLVLKGAYRIEERTMLEARLSGAERSYIALNDIIVGRASVGRPVYLEASVDAHRLALYRADAVIVATATGSTAYSFSAGGPILYPESRELLLTPVAPHLMPARSLVLPADARVEIKVVSDHAAVLSADGQDDRSLSPGETITVNRSPHLARFVRLSEAGHHYSQLAERLGWLHVVDVSSSHYRLEGDEADPDA